MSSDRTCTRCGGPLPEDIPEGAPCPACAQADPDRTVLLPAPAGSPIRAPILQTVGDYEVLDKLGQGGMGAVYRARQISLDRIVALKVLPAQYGDDPDYIGRFQREAKVASSLRHPNLVGVYACGSADGCHFIAMELVEGENLHERLRQGRMDIGEALSVTAYVARGLQCGWETAQLVHRDIKPSNIYLSYDGEVKVGDLGLAKSLSSNTTGLTQTGTMMGTPHYMSPEQCRGDKTIDFRADIYSLGCTLFEMLTGKPPYPGNDPIAIVRQHLDAPPAGLLKAMPGCPLPLALLVGRMLKKAPRERHANYGELIAEIESLHRQAEGGTLVSGGGFGSAGERVTPAIVEERPNWIPSAIMGGVLIALCVIFIPNWKTNPPVPEEDAAILATPKPLPQPAATPAPQVAAAKPTPAPVRVPAVASFGPWQPLFTDAEWKETVPGQREVVDGRMHLQNNARALKPQPFADGAIRARIRFREGSKTLGIQARSATTDNRKYKIEVGQIYAELYCYTPKGFNLGRYTLPKPLQPGDTVLVELRLQGDRVTALLDGAVVLEARDSRVTDPGQWGILADDGWFESVEVQTPLPTAAAAQPSGPAIAATKDAPFVNSLGMKFVPVPIAGGPTAGKTVLFSVWETRVQDYAAFATETKREWSKPDFVEQGPTHPALMVSWDGAAAFCAWLTERERKAGKLGATESYRLPSDHEWSCAVGIGANEDPAKTPAEKSKMIADIFPWGTTWPPPENAGNYWSEELRPLQEAGKFSDWTGQLPGYRDGYATTSPVGSYAANRFGLFDLGGNAWEWCEDWFDGSQRERVMRGGSWSERQRDVMLSSKRHRKEPIKAYNIYGFRCVLEVAPASTATSTIPPAAGQDVWENLLTPLTPDVLAKIGDGWRRENEALRSPNQNFARLPLGTFAGTSYQVRVRLLQLIAKNGFAIVLPVADRRAVFALDGAPDQGFFTGLDQVNGKRGKELPGSVPGRQVKDSEPHELDVTVRLDGVYATITETLDARPLYAWTGPIAALSIPWPNFKESPDTLCLLTFAHDWRVLEVKAKRLAP